MNLVKSFFNDKNHAIKYIILLNCLILVLFSYFSFYSSFGKIILLLLVVIVLFFIPSKRFTKLFENFFQTIFLSKKLRFLFFSSVSVLAFFSFIFFRVSLSGDSAILVNNILNGTNYVPYIFNLQTNFFIVNLLELFLYQSPESIVIASYVLLGLISGMLYLFFSHLISKELFSNFRQLPFFLLLIFTPGLKIFFGEIEQYALPLLTLTIFIYFAIRYLKNKSSFVWVAATFFLSWFMHPHIILFFPVLILAPFIIKKRKLKKDFLTLGLATLFFVLISFVMQSNLVSMGDSMNVNIPPDICVNCVCGDLECNYSENDVHIDSDNLVSSLLVAGNYLLLSGPILFIGILFLFFRKPSNSISLFFKWLFILYIIRIFISKFASSLLYGDWSFALMYSPILSIIVGYYVLKSNDMKNSFFPILIISFIFLFEWILF